MNMHNVRFKSYKQSLLDEWNEIQYTCTSIDCYIALNINGMRFSKNITLGTLLLLVSVLFNIQCKAHWSVEYFKVYVPISNCMYSVVNTY